VAGFRSPFHDTHPFWVLVEIEGFAAAELDAILEEAAAEGFVAEALFAASQCSASLFADCAKRCRTPMDAPAGSSRTTFACRSP